MAVKISKSVMSDVSRSLERLATKHGGDILWCTVNRLYNQRRDRVKLKREIARKRMELEALERRR